MAFAAADTRRDLSNRRRLQGAECVVALRSGAVNVVPVTSRTQGPLLWCRAHHDSMEV